MYQRARCLMTMTRGDRIALLSKVLLASQFDEVVYRVGAPTRYLSSPNTAQTTRAIELLQWIDGNGKHDELDKAIEEVRSLPQNQTTEGKKPRSRSSVPVAVWVLLAMAIVVIPAATWFASRPARTPQPPFVGEVRGGNSVCLGTLV